MTYTMHSEWIDGTFDEAPTTTFSNKKTALRMAKAIAASSNPQITARILICLDGEATVAAFTVT